LVRAELTAPLSADTPVLDLPPDMAPIPRFRLEELAKYDERGRTSYQNGIHTGEHVGTHFDAPRHWVTGADLEDVASVPATRLVAPAVVIDRTHEADEDPDYLLRREDIEEWQREHGALPEGWLLFRTGWAARSHDQVRFLNADEHARGRSRMCALAGRGDPDPRVRGRNGRNPRRAGVSLRSRVPRPFAPPRRRQVRHHPAAEPAPAAPTGALLIVAPLRIVGGSGSPARVLALVENGAK
jgi:kynurenine formamidase